MSGLVGCCCHPRVWRTPAPADPLNPSTAGNKILLADGSLSIRVDEILSATELRGTVLNSKSLGERKVGAHAWGSDGVLMMGL